jgi:hypothetical protein
MKKALLHSPSYTGIMGQSILGYTIMSPSQRNIKKPLIISDKELYIELTPKTIEAVLEYARINNINFREAINTLLSDISSIHNSMEQVSS